MKNKNRILAIDLARGVSVLMLTVIHVFWMYGDTVTREHTLMGDIINFIGKGTPMFLIAMGFSFMLSRNQSIKKAALRGLMLMGAGYFMNTLKFIIPILIGIAPSELIAAYGWSEPVTFHNLLFLFQTGDILQLAGITLLLMGLINKLSANKFIPLILAAVIMASAKLMSGFRLDIPFVDYVFDLFWGAEWNVYFPIFPWASFILLGMFMGMWYKEKDHDTQFIFRKMLILGMPMLVAGGAASLYDFDYHFGDYFHLGPGGALYLAGFNFILLWFANLLATKVKPNKIFSFLVYASARVTLIYIIQWVLICWGMGIVGFQQLGPYLTASLIPIMTVITFLIQAQVERLLSARKQNRKIVAT